MSAIGPYRLDRVIGSGGMGTVHLATDTRLGRPVAIKMLVGHLGQAPEFLARFEREAAVLGRLDSPHIIPIYDHGRHESAPYIVMQYAAGGDLGRALQRYGPMPPMLAADVCSQVADALAAAHSVGVVHRDVKPGNVLLRDDRLERPHVYLCDFGVAFTEASGLTATGTLAGTWNYVAPERAEGDPGSPASDVYAVGCLLHEALTGRPPYTGTDVEVALAHINDPVPHLAVHDPLTAALDAIMSQAMAKDPAQRQRSAAELRDQLAALVDRPSTFSGAGAPRARRRGLVAGLAVGAAVVVAAGGLLGWRALGGDGTAPPPVAHSASPTASTSPPARHIVAGDVDGDGRGDLLLMSHAVKNHPFYRSSGTALAKTPSPRYTSGALCEADTDGNGSLDFVSSTGYGSNLTLTDRSPRARAETTDVVLPPRVTVSTDALACGDFDGDGRADVAVWGLDRAKNAYLFVVSRRSDGTWTRAKLWGQAPAHGEYADLYTTFLVADVDGDGKDDLLARLSDADRVTLTTWRSTGTSFRTDGPSMTIDNDRFAVGATGDFDGDGRDEFASVDLQNRVRVWDLDPAGTHWTSTLRYAGSGDSLDFYNAAGASDLNGDGKDDLVLLPSRGHSVDVLLSTGDGFSALAHWQVPGLPDYSSVTGSGTPLDWSN